MKSYCPVCNSVKFEYVTKQYRKKVSEKTIVMSESLYQCMECDTIHILPIKDFNYLEEGDRYYGQMRLSIEEKEGLLQHIKWAQVPKYDCFREKILEKKFSEYKKWLDVGSCGYATLFRDFDFTTIEPDEHMVSLAKELFDDQKIFCSDLVSFSTKEKYDAIIFNHSFYCIANPRKTIEKIGELIDDNGIVVIGIGHIFMNSLFTSDSKISSIEDILLGETHKVYYCKESLEYLFNQSSYELTDEFIMQHDIPSKGNRTQYLVFKKSKNNLTVSNKVLLKQSKEKIDALLEYYQEDFEKRATNNFTEFNNNDTVFIGNKELFFEVSERFDLSKIKGFIDFDQTIDNGIVNQTRFYDFSFLNNNEFKNIVILDLKNFEFIRATLEDNFKVHHRIYVPTRLLSENVLFYSIKSKPYMSNAFEYSVHQTIQNRTYEKIMDSFKTTRHNVAIFGTALAGEIAFLISKRFNLKIICFIDDNKSGFYCATSIPIVSRKEFSHQFSGKIDLVIKGPSQKGLDTEFFDNIQVVEVENI